MINIEPVKAFNDNYIWLVTTYEGSIVIDPGESKDLINFIDKNGYKLEAIFITHHHFDHTGGIDDLRARDGIDVYGPNNNIDSINKRLKEGDKVSIIGLEFEILEVPGHTLDHIAYYCENNGSPLLFCGDTLFSAGCGRVFEGTFEQMYHSIQKLKNLPKNTQIYCGHEYTINNLEFAKTVEPFNKDIISSYNNALNLQNNDIPTLPALLSTELKINPFLRSDIREVQANIMDKFKTNKVEEDIFTAIRQWKDIF
jgi:hydroxyacylglutathione hydrolase